jgi:5'-nucleotidase
MSIHKSPVYSCPERVAACSCGGGMRVLLTNDDGVYAPGLMALRDELKVDFDVWVVAPESEMSAVGHGITLISPLRVRRAMINGEFFGLAVTGTPADCVKIGVQELMGDPPDIILSGINPGANVGVNVLYSGTVSAAAEGAFLGIRSAALSLDVRRDPDFRFAARFGREVIRFIERFGLKEGTALNVNIPGYPPDQIAGVAITSQGTARFQERFERRTDPRGEFYYWLSGEIPQEEDGSDSDAKALRDRWITITPIMYDLTCREEVARLRSCPLPDIRRMV